MVFRYTIYFKYRAVLALAGSEGSSSVNIDTSMEWISDIVLR